MSNELLIKKTKGYSFNDFVSDLLQLIRCDQWEQLQSPGMEGHYFRSYVLGVEITLVVVEDSRFEDYNFCIRFTPEIAYRGEYLPFDGLCDSIARKLAVHGYEIVRPINRDLGSEAVHYRKNPDKVGDPWKIVVTEKVQGMPPQQLSFRLGEKV